jgi:hypothetical protein
MGVCCLEVFLECVVMPIGVGRNWTSKGKENQNNDRAEDLTLP